MNILPKKRWHVRTKENIARVRKDEAEAAERERQEQLRVENADREARLRVLKQKSRQRLEEAGISETETPHTITTSEHINLFSDLDHSVQTTNKNHDEEVKEKKEEYEKKIGYLTYLGQDTNEALKKKNWYEVSPESSRFSRSNDIKVTYDKLVLKDQDGKPKSRELDVKDGEINWKAKQKLDPLNAFKKYCPDKTKFTSDSTKLKIEHTNIMKNKYKISKTKKNKINTEDNKKKMQKLREARLKREQQEKRKTEMFLTGINESSTTNKEENASKVKAKYNSQFNPELARQNYR